MSEIWKSDFPAYNLRIFLRGGVFYPKYNVRLTEVHLISSDTDETQEGNLKTDLL